MTYQVELHIISKVSESVHDTQKIYTNIPLSELEEEIGKRISFNTNMTFRINSINSIKGIVLEKK